MCFNSSASFEVTDHFPDWSLVKHVLIYLSSKSQNVKNYTQMRKKKYFEHINEDKAHFAIFEFHTRSNVNEKEWVLEAWSKPVSNKLLHERNVFVSS